MSGEDAPRPCLENLIVPEIKQTNKQTFDFGLSARHKTNKQTNVTPPPNTICAHVLCATHACIIR
jgi:hypothetical protein